MTGRHGRLGQGAAVKMVHRLRNPFTHPPILEDRSPERQSSRQNHSPTVKNDHLHNNLRNCVTVQGCSGILVQWFYFGACRGATSCTASGLPLPASHPCQPVFPAARRLDALASGMDLGRRLDALPLPALSAREKLLAALEMYDEGVALQRLVLRRRSPQLSEPELDAALQRWLARDDAAR
jgi:Rv0078B-related antitoxin